MTQNQIHWLFIQYNLIKCLLLLLQTLIIMKNILSIIKGNLLSIAQYFLMNSSEGLCQNCNQVHLIVKEDQLYCSRCHIYRKREELQQEMLFVPQGYRPNTERRQTSRQIRVNLLMQSLIDRYSVCSGSDLKMLIQQFERYRQSKKKCQSYESVCAAIFYYQYRQSLRKTLKDFTVENGIDRQQFNRCFVEYSQKKNNEGNYTTDQSIEPETIDTILEQCKDFLKVIADTLFQKIILKKSLYDQIIDAITSKIKKYLLQQNQIYPIPSLLFRALKELKFKISVRNFTKICKQNGKPTSPATILKYQKEGKEYSKQGSCDKATSEQLQ